MTTAFDRMVTYSAAPDTYDPPSPEQCGEAAAQIAALRAALVDMSGRIDWASNMFHNSQRWHDEDPPNGDGTLWDWVHAPMNLALNA
jgi:hypothetical protein